MKNTFHLDDQVQVNTSLKIHENEEGNIVELPRHRQVKTLVCFDHGTTTSLHKKPHSYPCECRQNIIIIIKLIITNRHGRCQD